MSDDSTFQELDSDDFMKSLNATADEVEEMRKNSTQWGVILPTVGMFVSFVTVALWVYTVSMDA